MARQRPSLLWLALGLVAASLSARVEAAPGPRLAEAERKERALGRDPKKLRFRSNIEVVVAAWRDAGRGASGEELIAAMEGMSFETPKGTMTFRKEDHQALQEMYHWRMKKDAPDNVDLLELVRVIPAREMTLPIRNKR